ncbi:MAG: DUF308 domain-containing protein [Thermoproteota archaeon]|nr:DUF308 domain-containing protein [Thermoproteota archaeon]
MTRTHVIDVKSPSWVRALQIGIGAFAIGLSLSAVIFPVLTVVATFTAAAIILLLFGVEQVVAGIFLYKRSRFAHIGLGILVIILSSIVMAYPLASAAFVVLLAAVSLLFSGIASVISGLRGGRKSEAENGRKSTSASTGSRALSIAAGALAIALSIMIMVSPLFGVALAALVIGIALFVYGIRLVVTGISGRGEMVTSAAAS